VSDIPAGAEITLSPEELERVERVCDRFERAWRSGQRPQIKAYVEELDTPVGRDILRKLLGVELAYRVQHGERPAAQEYQALFPDHAKLIEEVFAEPMVAHRGIEGATTPPDSSALDPEPPPTSEPTPIPDYIGRYKVIRRLGGGTYGDVYLAHDPVMDCDVAVKVPSARLLATQRAREELLREVRSAARLRHEGIVRAHHFPEEAEGHCYIVHEYIEGESLAERIEPARIAADPLPSHEAARIVAAVAEALHYAHLQEMFHRDVKPANILLDRQGRPKVTDFGIAVREEDLAGQRGVLAGTLPYMAPEQVRREGHHVDGRTDIYSLGVVLYELLCGRRPFEAATKDELEDQILHREARPIRQIKDAIPGELDQICLKALSKRVSDRYPTAKDMASDLVKFAKQAQHPKRSEHSEPAQELGKHPKNLLHRIWGSLDSNLQDAFSLAYNKKRRQGSNRISTRDFFQALVRINDQDLRTLIESLPEGALPERIGADVPANRQLLNANPLLSDCVHDSLSQFIKSAPLPRKLSPVDIFVDIGQHGHGPSVARLREHGVTAEELEKRIERFGLSVVRRQKLSLQEVESRTASANEGELRTTSRESHAVDRDPSQTIKCIVDYIHIDRLRLSSYAHQLDMPKNGPHVPLWDPANTSVSGTTSSSASRESDHLRISRLMDHLETNNQLALGRPRNDHWDERFLHLKRWMLVRRFFLVQQAKKCQVCGKLPFGFRIHLLRIYQPIPMRSPARSCT
jgi:serine/threonine protein kinase